MPFLTTSILYALTAGLCYMYFSDAEWMFLARHADSTKKVNEEFDESVFVNTLVMDARGQIEFQQFCRL